MAELSGKRAWITGGGTGIGAASARALAKGGAEVILSGRRPKPLQKVADEIAAAGGVARAMPLDVRDATAMADAAAEIGSVDILIANAGLNLPDRALDRVTTDGWEKVVGINLNGVFYAVQAVLPGMRRTGGGTLILVSSWAGRYATAMTGAAYNATKRAVIALGESVNAEEGRHGIRCTVVMPGEVATDILDARPNPPPQAERDRMLQAEDLGATIRFVAEMPARACLNEILMAPTWNRFYTGFDEL